jgi:hypothetical protein
VDSLADEPFSYQSSKDGKALLYYQGKLVQTLNGEKAARFLGQVEDAGDSEAQLMMAKATRNFKRGNEKLSAKSKR